MLPDSPRYLASVGRKEEARELLLHLRANRASADEIDREYLEIVTTAEDSKPSSPVQFAKILLGLGGRPGTSLGRRAWLCVWLQIMASWTGITVRREKYTACHVQLLIFFVGGYRLCSSAP